MTPPSRLFERMKHEDLSVLKYSDGPVINLYATRSLRAAHDAQNRRRWRPYSRDTTARSSRPLANPHRDIAAMRQRELSRSKINSTDGPSPRSTSARPHAWHGLATSESACLETASDEGGPTSSPQGQTLAEAIFTSSMLAGAQ